MNWIKDEDNSADLGTRNLNHASHTKHTKALCGDIKKFNFCHKFWSEGRYYKTAKQGFKYPEN